jgi:beta-glucosidase-like glycosyl hydrolase
MHALNETGNVPVKCINAGADILLHPADADEVVNELKQAIAAGELKETKVDAAVERILKYKIPIKGLRTTAPDYNRHIIISAEISDRSVTCVKATPGVLPLADMRNMSLVFTGDGNDFDISQIKSLFSEDAQCLRAGEISPENTQVSGTVVFALFTSVAAWKGSSGIKEEETSVIKELIKTTGKSVVVSFGSPYVLRHFREADVLIAAYDPGEQAQLSVIKCLKGERECRGSLPVDLYLS